MNDFPQEPSPEFRSLSWPILLTSLAFNFLLGFYLYTTAQQTIRTRQELKATNQQIETYRNSVAASRNIQTLLQAVASDLLEMSDSDSDVRKIVDKYNIRKANPDSSSQK